MRIDRLLLKNFRCFSQAQLDFAPGFNVLIGENGAGKTAMLEAIALLVSSVAEPLQRRARWALGEHDAREVFFERPDSITAEAQWPVEMMCAAFVMGGPVTWGRRFEATGEARVDGTSAEAQTYVTNRFFDHEAIARAEQMASDVASGEDRVLPMLAYHRANRLWSRGATENGAAGIGRAVGSRTRGYSHWSAPQANGGELFAWFKRREEAARTSHPVLLEVVRRVIRDCVEGCADVRFDALLSDLVLTFADGYRMRFSLLSDGVRNMCALVSDLAWRCVELNPHLGDRATHETPGVVLIDEIDLHLHPRWQRRAVDDLRRNFPRVQFFATTHSPLILSGLMPGEVIRLERDARGEVVCEKPDEDPRLLTASQINRDFFGIPGLFPTDLAERYRQYGLLAGSVERSDAEEVEVQRLYAALRDARVEVTAPEPRRVEASSGVAREGA